MTLLPSSDFGITGWPGNAYAVNEVCAHPECGARSAHAHHCWRRSFIRKDYEWVRLPDGTIIGNRIGLCVDHHDQVTGEVGGYRARLVWMSGLLWWEDKEGEGWETVAPIDPQPPLMVAVPVVDRATGKPVEIPAHGHAVKSEQDVCPTCGHHTRNPDEPHAKLPRRKKKTWAVTVPDDSEVGADILDGWIDDLAIPLGFTDQTSTLRRYHTLAVALAWLTQNRQQFIADIAEAAEKRLAS